MSRLVDRWLLRCAFRWPIGVAVSWGGYLRKCLVVKVGKVVRNPAVIAFAKVVRVGENKLAV